MSKAARSQSITTVVRKLIKSHNVELQFWGYELGNVLAAVAGIGGFAAMLNSFGVSNSASRFVIHLVQQQPDLAVTLCMAMIVLISPLIRKVISCSGNAIAITLYDYCVVAIAMSILIFALRTDTSWIIVSGSSFVVASALLRYGLTNPVFLKLGGMLLQTGGVALGVFGVTLTLQSAGFLDAMLGCFTVATGFYVCGAGMLTYLGGKFNTIEYERQQATALQQPEPRSSFNPLLHPVTGWLSIILTTFFDRPYTWLCQWVVNPSIFWIKQSTKNKKPFLTSMAARLPWRLVTGLAALATQTDAGVAFAMANFLWAIGDVAIGSIDWENIPVKNNSKQQMTPTTVRNTTDLALPFHMSTEKEPRDCKGESASEEVSEAPSVPVELTNSEKVWMNRGLGLGVFLRGLKHSWKTSRKRNK